MPFAWKSTKASSPYFVIDYVCEHTHYNNVSSPFIRKYFQHTHCLSSLTYHYFWKIIYLFIILLYKCMCFLYLYMSAGTHVPSHICGSQKAAFRSWFSLLPCFYGDITLLYLRCWALHACWPVSS